MRYCYVASGAWISFQISRSIGVSVATTILIRVARLLILSLAVLEGQFRKSVKRKSDLGEHSSIEHEIMVLALSLIK